MIAIKAYNTGDPDGSLYLCPACVRARPCAPPVDLAVRPVLARPRQQADRSAGIVCGACGARFTSVVAEGANVREYRARLRAGEYALARALALGAR